MRGGDKPIENTLLGRSTVLVFCPVGGVLPVAVSTVWAFWLLTVVSTATGGRG